MRWRAAASRRSLLILRNVAAVPCFALTWRRRPLLALALTWRPLIFGNLRGKRRVWRAHAVSAQKKQAKTVRNGRARNGQAKAPRSQKRPRNDQWHGWVKSASGRCGSMSAPRSVALASEGGRSRDSQCRSECRSWGTARSPGHYCPADRTGTAAAVKLRQQQLSVLARGGHSGRGGRGVPATGAPGATLAGAGPTKTGVLASILMVGGAVVTEDVAVAWAVADMAAGWPRHNVSDPHPAAF